MGIWKQGEGKYSNKESKFAVQFKEDHPELAKKLSNEKGYLQAGKTVTEEGYIYTVKEIVSKKPGPNNGKTFTLVERVKQTGDHIIDNLKSEEQKAHESSTNWDEVHKRQEERDAAFEKRHNQLITALENLTESVNALMHRMDAAEGI